VRRGWQSLNTGPRFYLHLIRRTGWLWIYTSWTTNRHPFKPNKLSVPFLYPGVPAGLTPFRGLVPLGRRNLVPILPPAHPLGGGSFWMEGGAVGHNIERGPLEDHPSQICFNLVQRFQRKDLNVIFYQNMSNLYNLYKLVERKISQKKTEYMLIYSLSCSCS
jgi:hypothetical protein